MENRKKKYRLASRILKLLPESKRKQWDRSLEKIFQEITISPRENRRLMLEFQLKQIHMALWGLSFSLILGIYLLVSAFSHKELAFSRNPFGAGSKELNLEMEYEGEKETFLLELEEQKLSKAQEQKVYCEFLKDLKKEILGKNSSLSKVNSPLNLVDSLEGYPFSITYETEDPAIIDWNGDLGEKAESLSKGETLDSYILVQAFYKSYEYEARIDLTMIPAPKKKLSVFEEWKEKLIWQEDESREKGNFVIETEDSQMTIKDSSAKSAFYLPVFCLILTALLMAREYMKLKDSEKKRHRENLEDFPLIVHLLTLYMGAGLSFASSVERISKDYEKSQRSKEKRFSFEQIMVMDHYMQMGIRPKEACYRWGQHFEEKIYAKFAMLLSQSFSKGSKEIRSMMEKEQQDALQVQIDCVRKEGEEASTKLLFPMIVLLFLIMILVMFPAVMQFYGI